jgi:ATP synthase protein I
MAGRFPEQVGASERRKLRSRRRRDRTLWIGVSTFGMIGWSVAVPTLLGAVLGLWLDRVWPAGFSWTVALILGGVVLGGLTAWHWVSRESRLIEEEEKEGE